MSSTSFNKKCKKSQAPTESVVEPVETTIISFSPQRTFPQAQRPRFTRRTFRWLSLWLLSLSKH